MKDLDRLAPDQRAVLSLVLEQDRSYEEVASLLGMSEQAVRDRAHAALDALAHDTHPTAVGARGHVGQAPAAESATTNGAVAQNGRGTGEAQAARSVHLAPRRGSRLAGALLLGALVAVIVVAAILISGGSGGGSKASSQVASHSTTTRSSSTTSSNATSAQTPKLDKTLTLAPTDPSLKAAGVAYVLSQGKRRAFYVKAEGMPPSSGFFYAVWLYDSPSHSAPLGRAPTVKSDGRMEGGGPLPANASSYHKIVITRETNLHASQPGEIVLSGAFAIR